jgi:hypothetical protein
MCLYLARTGERGQAYTILVHKPQGKDLLGRTGNRWGDKLDFKQRGCKN